MNLLIGLAVLALILFRQMQVRPVRASMRLPLILAIIGVVELTQFLKQNQHIHHAGTIFAALAGSLALAAITGAIRAATVRVWFDGGQALRQGTWLTALLWIVSLAAHLGYDYLVDGKGSQAGLGTASLTLYFAVTYTIQRLILQVKAQRIAATPSRTLATQAPALRPGDRREPSERHPHSALGGNRAGPTPLMACDRASVSTACAAVSASAPVRALISLGSAGVVASVVPVNDPATVPLMLALHDHLRAGLGLAEALTLARHAAGADSVASATAYSFIALGT